MPLLPGHIWPLRPTGAPGTEAHTTGLPTTASRGSQDHRDTVVAQGGPGLAK